MICTQDTVNRILERAKKSPFGLEAPERPINMRNYAGATTQTLAMALVGGFHAKYDLISILQAAMEEAYEQGVTTPHTA